jgi:hypothetical protein
VLTARSRKGRKLEELDDEGIRARIAAATAEIRQIDALPPAQVRGKEAETLKRYERAVEIVEVGRAELGSREQERMIANLPARRAFRDLEDERRKRRDARQPVVSALRFAAARRHPELDGATLAADRLSESEGQELAAIVKKARAVVYQEGAEPLSEAKTRRYEELLGVAACGEPAFFEQQRREKKVREKVRALGEERRLASLPRRPQLAEPGSIELPRFACYSWLRDDTDGRWTLADVACLVAFLAIFENKDPGLVANARLEELDGEPVLVIAGGIGSEFRFAGQIGGDSVDTSLSGHVRLRNALRTLSANRWLEIEATSAETRIKLGPRAKALGQAD